jgi:hypothetical protein
MIQLIIIGIFVLLVAYDSKGCDELNIICKTICKQDGDELGIVIKDKCYCANYRSLDKIVIRVPKNGGLVAEKRKPYIWE